MRRAYQEQLDSITDGLVEMSRLAGTAIDRAGTALLDADLTLAESVIGDDERIDRLSDDLEERALDLLALQQPVAGDLRFVVAALRICTIFERMGDLAAHVAGVARRRYPAHAIPDELRGTITEMGEVAEQIATKAGGVVGSQHVATALQLETDDDRMDELHRTLFRLMLDGAWDHGVEAAVDVSLVGRYYERFADHGVSVANRVVYLVTGDRYDEVAARADAEQA